MSSAANPHGGFVGDAQFQGGSHRRVGAHPRIEHIPGARDPNVSDHAVTPQMNSSFIRSQDTHPVQYYAEPPEYSEVNEAPQLSDDFGVPIEQFAAMQINNNPTYQDTLISRNGHPIPRGGEYVPRSPVGDFRQQSPVGGSYVPSRQGTISSDPSLNSANANLPSTNNPSIMPLPYGYDAFDGAGPQQFIPPPSRLYPNYAPAFSRNVPQYDPLHNAASNIVGMGPVGAPSSSQPSFGHYPEDQGSISSRMPSSLYQQNPHLALDAPDAVTPAFDNELRPSLQRSGTTASVILRTQKTKAVDLSAPPFTKEYVDQYRQRIKGDPDPEAHFLYAKYLIEAAKRVGSDVKDQRAVKKYRDLLIVEALKVIRRLATQGQPYDEAQFFLANCYGTGMLGLQVDHERAYHLYLQAAKQNHAAACYRVAVCNEIGAGTRRELPRAAAFYRKAASLGDTPAMYKLGMILLNGSLGEQKNPREAINWLKRAAEQADQENPHALHELGLLHEKPNSELVVHDPAYARALFTQAAHLGYAPSQYRLGQCYEYGTLTCPVDPRRSIAWYTKAAEKGNAEAELALSGWYLTGSEGVLKQSDSEAYLWARRAANKGLSSAEYAVGYYAETGIGIKQDIEFAKRWYMRAAAQGNKRAMNRLTEMKRMGNKRVNMARPTRQQAKDECIIG